MKAISVNTTDSTCSDACFSSGGYFRIEDFGYIAVPDCYSHASYVTRVARKHSPDYVRLDFPDGTYKNIGDYYGDSPEEAIQEAFDAFEEDKNQYPLLNGGRLLINFLLLGRILT